MASFSLRSRQSAVPRHSEINEILARKIVKEMEESE